MLFDPDNPLAIFEIDPFVGPNPAPPEAPPNDEAVGRNAGAAGAASAASSGRGSLAAPAAEWQSDRAAADIPPPPPSDAEAAAAASSGTSSKKKQKKAKPLTIRLSESPASAGSLPAESRPADYELTAAMVADAKAQIASSTPSAQAAAVELAEHETLALSAALDGLSQARGADSSRSASPDTPSAGSSSAGAAAASEDIGCEAAATAAAGSSGGAVGARRPGVPQRRFVGAPGDQSSQPADASPPPNGASAAAASTNDAEAALEGGATLSKAVAPHGDDDRDGDGAAADARAGQRWLPEAEDWAFVLQVQIAGHRLDGWLCTRPVLCCGVISGANQPD